MADRFRGFLPVVVDVETGGFNARTDALLEIAVSLVHMDDFGRLFPAETIDVNVEPFDGARIDPKSLEITGIQLDSPLRAALPEVDALRKIFQPVRREVRETGCQRAILVGHNSFFDLSFLNAAIDQQCEKYIKEHGRFLRLFVRTAIDVMQEERERGEIKGNQCLFLCFVAQPALGIDALSQGKRQQHHFQG